MRKFIILWLGQLVSTIGSFMTIFAVTIWVWEQTDSATALSLIAFSAQFPRIFITFLAGIIIDRFSRKRLMILGDTSAILATMAVGILYTAGNLQIWHLCLIVALQGSFGQIQQLAYSASISSIVPEKDLTRAGSMIAGLGYGSAIVAPALAGILYPIIDLGGIVLIDVITFSAAILTLLATNIPSPVNRAKANQETMSIKQQLTFGFRYIWNHPHLLAMAIAFTMFAIPNDINRALYNPMILARTGGDAEILGIVTTVAGIGGVLGALIISVWGGFKNRVKGMLNGFIGAGVGKAILGLGTGLSFWIPAQFFATMNTPLYLSSSNAIWYSKVPPELQGRVLSADHLIGLIVSATSTLIAGPLADYVFEPAMQSEGILAPVFSPIFGTGSGAGMALLYVLTAVWMAIVGVVGYFRPRLQAVDLNPKENLK
ncbi:MAG: MFS transporter [Cyanobacteria bacterium P01_F01_bin.143]